MELQYKQIVGNGVEDSHNHFTNKVDGNGQYKCLSDYEMEITKVDETMREKLNVNDIDALKRDLMDIRSMFNKKVNELNLE